MVCIIYWDFALWKKTWKTVELPNCKCICNIKTCKIKTIHIIFILHILNFCTGEYGNVLFRFLNIEKILNAANSISGTSSWVKLALVYIWIDKVAQNMLNFMCWGLVFAFSLNSIFFNGKSLKNWKYSVLKQMSISQYHVEFIPNTKKQLK